MTQAARDCLTVASQDNPSGREFLPDAWCRGRLKSDQLGGRAMEVKRGALSLDLALDVDEGRPLVDKIRRALAQGVSDHGLFGFNATFVMFVNQLLHCFYFVATFRVSV